MKNSKIQDLLKSKLLRAALFISSAALCAGLASQGLREWRISQGAAALERLQGVSFWMASEIDRRLDFIRVAENCKKLAESEPALRGREQAQAEQRGACLVQSLRERQRAKGLAPNAMEASLALAPSAQWSAPLPAPAPGASAPASWALAQNANWLLSASTDSAEAERQFWRDYAAARMSGIHMQKLFLPDGAPERVEIGAELKAKLDLIDSQQRSVQALAHQAAARIPKTALLRGPSTERERPTIDRPERPERGR